LLTDSQRKGSFSNSDSAKASKDHKSINGRKRKNPRVNNRESIDAKDEVGSRTTGDPNAIEGASSMQAKAEHLTAVKAWRVEIYTPD